MHLRLDACVCFVCFYAQALLFDNTVFELIRPSPVITQDARLSASRTHENRDRRSEPAVQPSSRPRPGVNGSAGGAAGGAMPWMLPATQDSRASDVQKQRETLDKMMAGGRWDSGYCAFSCAAMNQYTLLLIIGTASSGFIAAF